MNDIRDDTRDGFAAVFGVEPSGLWSAPGSITLLRSGEQALAIAIDRRTVVALALRDDSIARIASSHTDELVEVDLRELSQLDFVTVETTLTGWAAYPFGVVWALGQHGADLAGLPGFDLFIESDVPVAVGLGSSSALQGAVALALDDAWRLGFDRRLLAELCRVAESATGGRVADVAPALAALLGEKDRAVAVAPERADRPAATVPLGFARRNLAVLVMAPDPDSPLLSPRQGSEVRAVELALSAVEADELGELLDADYLMRRDGLGEATVQLDLAVDAAQSAGALGAGMTRGASGPVAIALVEIENLSRIQVAIDGAFSEHGYGPPDTFVVTAGHGAAREP